MEMTLPPIHIPPSYNYIGVFLSLSCNLSCSYCINYLSGDLRPTRGMSGKQWAQGLNRIQFLKEKIPVSLQGGEPSIHKDFYQIINSTSNHIDIDILTNLQFSPECFFKEVSPQRLKRDAKYASIRVSYHPETMDLAKTIHKIKKMQHFGYSIGLYTIDHPNYENIIREIRLLCKKEKIDFRTKDFLGVHDGKKHGKYAYSESTLTQKNINCECKTSELLIGPTGDIFRCHHDLYRGLYSVGHLLDPKLKIEEIFRPCQHYGSCNPCDVKIKNNRYQSFGHTSVEIKNISPS